MRRRLIEVAMLVFAEKGIEASQIDDVMKAAEVSRGGFYGHFRSMAELLGAIGADLGNETIGLIEQRVAGIADPAERIAHGLLLYLACAMNFPQFARFVAAAAGNVNNPHSLVYDYLPPHIAQGVDMGRFAVTDMAAAVDLLAGTMLAAVARIATGEVSDDYRASVVASILMALGVSRATARKLSLIEVEGVEAPADGLLMRTHQRHRAASAARA